MWCNMLWQQIVINQQMQKTRSMKIQFTHTLLPWLNCSINYNSKSGVNMDAGAEQPINLYIWQSNEQIALLRYGAIQRNNNTSTSVCFSIHCHWFLGMFTKLKRATISFIISICPPVCMEQLGTQWTDYHEIWYISIFKKSVLKIQVKLKSDFTWRPTYIFEHISLNSS
jgi:hypothetical protein